MKLALAVLAALIPAPVAWWWGRQLVASLDSPVFAELWFRQRRRLANLGTGCAVVAVLLAGWHGLWLLPLLALATLAGAFPARRTILEESWGLAGYIGWLVRLVMVFAAFWILVLITPAIIARAGPERAWVALGLGAVMALLIVRPQSSLLALLGTKPMSAEEVPALAPFMETLADLSSAPRPSLHRLAMGGGRWVNALAVPHAKRPAVIFTDQLLEMLDPAEVRAVLAHEMAHLEQHDRPHLRRLAAGLWLLVVFSLLAEPASRWLLGASHGWGLLAWVVLMFVLTRWRLARHRARETAGDLRALELCGDAESLVSALVKLHEAGRFPRRLGERDEQRITHPSLARRAQAIRRAASIDVPAALPVEVVAFGVRAGERVLLEADRVTWLEGVADCESRDLEVLRASAAGSRSIVYARLRELRLEARAGGRHELIAVDRDGRRWSTPVLDANLAEVQRALDGVDAQLAPSPRAFALSRLTSGTGTARLWAALTLLCALVVPASGAAAVPALLGLVVPRATWLAAAGVGAVAGGLLSVLRLQSQAFAWPLRLGAAAGVALGGVALLVLAVARTRRLPEERDGRAWLPAALLVAALVVVWTGILVIAWLQGGGELDLYRLHRAVRGVPSTAVWPLAAAACLVLTRRRAAPVLACAALVLVAPGLWLGSDGFRDAWVEDLLLPRGRWTTPSTVDAVLLRTLEAPGRPTVVRLSPDGATIAVGAYQGWDEDSPHGSGPMLRWTTLWAADGEIVLDQIPAVELRFLDAGSAVVLAPLPGRQGIDAEDDTGVPRFELRLLRSDHAGGEGWSVALPRMAAPRLRVRPGDGSWCVTGTEAQVYAAPSFLRLAGRVGSSELDRRVWRLVAQDGWASQWSALGARAALAQRFAGSGEYGVIDHPFLSMFTRWESELVLVGERGSKALGTTRLNPYCHETGVDEASAVCVASGGEWSHLWEVAADDVRGSNLGHLGSVPAPYISVAAVTDESVLLWAPGREPVVLDRATGELMQVRLDDDRNRTNMTLAGRDLLAELRSDRGRSRVLVYRVKR